MGQNIGIAVGVIILDGNRILLCKRIDPGREYDGTWALIGGKLEHGETFEQCAIRETKEETDIDIDEIEVVCLLNSTNYDFHFVAIGLLARKWHGTAKIMEPDQHCGLEWFDMDNLPGNLFGPTADVLKKYKEKRFY